MKQIALSRPIRFIVLPALILLGMMAVDASFAPIARAYTLIVDDSGDTLHSPGCATTGTGTCTLRDAITFANSSPGPDTITFTGFAGGTITLGSPLPTISDDLTIDGTAENITISGGGSVHILTMNNVTLNLTALKLVNGRGDLLNAGAVTVPSGGTLNVHNSTFSGNIAIDQTCGGALLVKNGGTLNVTNSTFSNNSSEGAAAGGAVCVLPLGTASVTNSTFGGNHTDSTGNGGAIWSTSTLNVTNSTFSGNYSTAGSGGGIYLAGGTTTLKNSIIANSSSGNDCVNSGGTLTADAFNIDSDGSCNNATQHTTAEIGLGALADNGGPTQTMSLGTNSAAIDAGDNTVCAAAPVNNLDQRGATRPQGAQCDVGAFESTRQAGPNFVVNSAADTDDGACDGLVPGGSNCTLREAINAANGLSGADTITFNIPSGGACSSANTCTITLGSTLPKIATDVTIDGAPNNGHITVSGNNVVQIMTISGGVTNLNALTLVNASAPGIALGGAIDNSATLNISNSTFSGNGANSGGAIYNGATLNITNSTFSGNYTSSSGNGGAIWSGGTLNVTNSTFSGNNAAGSGGGIFVQRGTTTLKNTVLANNTGGDCHLNGGTLTADDYNIDSDGTCDNADQYTTADIALGALADNGGPTWTMAIDENSVAWNYGDNAVCAAAPVNNLDQRGQTRPQGIDCDTGAYEFVYSGWQTGPNFVVNSAADTEDGSCDVLGQGVWNQDCTLREAINAANARSGADTITFNIPSGGACSSANTCTITLTANLPYLTDVLTVDGAPNNGHITVNGADAHTMFWAQKDFNLNALTLAHGAAAGFGSGALNITGVTVTVTNSTFVHNLAASGGSIRNVGGTVTVVNSTFFDSPSIAIGNSSSGTTNIYNSTIDGNNQVGSVGISNPSGTVTLYNTIVANNEGDNCSTSGSPVTADASNIADDATCGSATQKTGAELNLQALADNGGHTQTVALGTGSVALDAGNDAVCAAAPVNGLDQRGVARPQGPHCDVGAVEMVELTVTTVGSGSALVSSTPAGIGCGVGATCTMPVSAAAQVTLTATPATGTIFQGWSGAGCSGTGTCVLTADSSKQVTATFTALGTVVIRKTTAPSGGSGFAFSGDLGAFTLKDRGKQVVSGLLPGTYTVREDDPSATGFALSGLVCTDSLASGQTSSGDVASRTATIRLDPGETVSCSFTNSQPNTISVEKVTIPDSTDSFAFNGGALGSFNVTAGSAHIIANAAAGSYTVTEADPAPAGYRLTKASCTDSATGQTTQGNLTTRSVTMTMTAGARIHCTFENTKLGIVVIRKASAPVGGSGFSFSGDFGAFVMKDGSKQVFRGVVPGSFTVTEDDPSGLGYQLSELTCTDSVQSGKPSTGSIATRTATINMEPGETVACTFVNAQDDVVTVNAVTVPDSTASFRFDGGALGAFSVTVGQPHVVPGVTPGSYTITQADPSAAGYTLSRISCTDSATGQTFSGNLTTRSVSLTMAPGERVSCTFENTTQAPRDLYFPIVAKQ